MDRTAEIAATWRRIRRPLQWPMESFRRTRVSRRGFVGYRFSRVRRRAVAGFAVGFALRADALPIDARPPEAVAYAFVEPVGSALYDALVTRRGSAVRRLVRAGAREGLPFEFRPGDTVAAIRHRSLRRPPPEIFVLSAADFFLESFDPLRSSGFLEAVRRATTGPGR
ncbi:MAG: hypothetical protein ACT4OI_07345 [Methanobacteriota archaeon]